MNKYENLNTILSLIYRTLLAAETPWLEDNQITLFQEEKQWTTDIYSLDLLGEKLINKLGKAIEVLDLPLDELISLGLNREETFRLTLRVTNEIFIWYPASEVRTVYRFIAKPLNAWEKLTNLAENFTDE